MNILTVDDHPLNLKLLRAQLEAEGHRVVEAANGLEALALLEHEPVDAIVSDILMPHMDGYRFCHEVRTSPRFYKLPIIIYTATYTSPGDEKLALEVGADKYLKKPANVRVIIESLEEVVNPSSLRQFKPVTPSQELHLLKEYSERLVHKLEEKNWELQATLEELRAKEERLRAIVETEPECVKTISREGGLLQMNPAGLAMFEAKTLEEMNRQPLLDLVVPEHRAAVSQLHERVMQGESGILEFEIIGLQGRRCWLETHAAPLHDQNGKVSSRLAITRDITARKRVEIELRAMNERYLRQEAALITLTRSDALLTGRASAALQEIAEVTARTLDVGRVSIWRYERDRRDIVCTELYERPEHRHSMGTVLREEEYPAYFRTLAAADVIAAHDAHHDPQTQEFSASYLAPLNIGAMLDAPVHLQGVMAGVLCCEHLGPARHWTADEQTFAVAVANLVSLMLAQAERKQMEEQLRQAQKMEAIGQLAGGIAHDFNNILGAILGNAELMKIEPAGGPEAEECLEAILSATHRAADLVQQILAFSRRRELKRQPMQLHLVVKEALKLLRASIPAAIEFRARVGITPTVLADPSEIHQVTMNLCTNAWHAFNNSPGIITVELIETEVNEAFAHSHPDLHPGRYVCLSVADTGCGMDTSTLARIFEPFFTTKPVGVGTGLGLAVVHGIMKNHDGGIVVNSQPGAGTTFHLYFPVFEAEIVDAPAPPQPVPHGHDEHVLFVDDEEPLVKLGQITLQRLGYRVTVAASAAGALELFRAEPEQFDLVITDLNMPSMNGTDLGAEMLRIRPELRIILATGYSANLDEAAAQKLGFSELLPKPYDYRKLGEAAQRVLQPRVEQAV